MGKKVRTVARSSPNLSKINRLESLHTEHKKTFGKETIISLVAFANTEGWKVYVGIDENGYVTGTEVG